VNEKRLSKFLQSVKPEPEYNNFLAGKSVAIVGPSKHILLENNGRKIDDCDVVIRLKWLPRKEQNQFAEHIGNKTNVMYSSVINSKTDYDFLSRTNINFTRHPVCELGVGLNSKMYHDICASSYSSEQYAFILKDYATENGWTDNKLASINSKSKYSIWPQLGFNAVMESIASDAKHVYITGLTMYHGGGHMLQKNKPPSHNKAIVEKHNGLLETLILLDTIEYLDAFGKRIETDNVLTKILNSYRVSDIPTDPATRKQLYISLMKTLSDDINNLVRDL
jgi:hypothetical protein